MGANGHDTDYAIQKEPNALAEAYPIAENFINGYPTALILGDNLFHGDKLHEIIESKKIYNPEQLFLLEGKDPKRYGVVPGTKVWF